MTATEYQLRLIDWQMFVTVTWSSKTLGSCRSREMQLWQFFREWCKCMDMKLYDLQVVVRWERGEFGDRPHAHCLIAGLPENKVHINECFRQMQRWNDYYGIARFRLFREHSNRAGACLASYIRKPSRAKDGNTYEMSKFDQADRMTINESAWNRMLAVSGAEPVAQARTS
jgi:hypothetical protein